MPTGWVQRWGERLGVAPGELASVVAPIWHGQDPSGVAGAIERRAAARKREQKCYGFEKHFDAVIHTHEEGVEAPAQERYVLACDRQAGARSGDLRRRSPHHPPCRGEHGHDLRWSSTVLDAIGWVFPLKHHPTVGGLGWHTGDLLALT